MYIVNMIFQKFFCPFLKDNSSNNVDYCLPCSSVSVPQSSGTLGALEIPKVSVEHLVLWMASFPLALSEAPFAILRLVPVSVRVEGPEIVKVLKSSRI